MTNSPISYKVALFIGRFQPFHLGHLYSLKKCLELAPQVIVGIGSSQESRTESNPWNFEERKRMIEMTLRGLAMPVRQAGLMVLEMVPIPDTPSDEEWVKNIELIVQKSKFLKREVVVVSNNEWVTRLMGEVGYPVFETGLFNREELEGVKIRELIRKGDPSWKLRVPESVSQIVTSFC